MKWLVFKDEDEWVAVNLEHVDYMCPVGPEISVYTVSDGNFRITFKSEDEAERTFWDLMEHLDSYRIDTAGE